MRMCKKLIALFLTLVTAYMFVACDSEPVCDVAVSIENSAPALMDGVIPATTPEKTIEHVKDNHRHQYAEGVVAPTCTHAGMACFECECGEKYYGDEIAAMGHAWEGWQVVHAATELTEGIASRVCAVCGATETKATPVIIVEHKHDYISRVTHAGCESVGYTTYTCNCGDSYTADETPATGHKWGGWVTVENPTDMVEGKSQRKCSACNSTETKSIEKLPHVHNYKKSIVREVSCKVIGITKYICSCGDSYTEETSAWGHDYGDWVVVKEATPDERGEEEITCFNCGKVLSRTFVFCADNDDADEIARLLIDYINAYRAEEGVAPATMMEKCMVYAKLRSEQMAAKGVAEHNTDDERAIATQMQYGCYVDPSEGYGRQEDPYYYVNGSEAVAKDRGTTSERIAETLASGFRNSTAHWDYVGARPYIAVGVTMDSDGYWYCCVVMGRVDLDEISNGS